MIESLSIKIPYGGVGDGLAELDGLVDLDGNRLNASAIIENCLADANMDGVTDANTDAGVLPITVM
jgi:hypothetical protein